MATLTEGFPCFFLSCKADARVKPAKTGHGPHSSKFLRCSVYCLFCVVLCTVCVYMCTVLLPAGGYPIAVNQYHIIRTQMFISLYCRMHLLTTTSCLQDIDIQSVTRTRTERGCAGHPASHSVRTVARSLYVQPRSKGHPASHSVGTVARSLYVQPRSAGHPASHSVGTVARSLYFKPRSSGLPCLVLSGYYEASLSPGEEIGRY